MSDLKNDIKETMRALYPQAIKRAEEPSWWRNPGLRIEAVRRIEDMITHLKPNAIECEQIVDALGGALRERYDNPTECLLRITLLKGDLERLDNGSQVDASDILAAYERATRRLNDDNV